MKFHASLPEDLKARLDLHLYSEIEGCIPRGALSNLMAQLVREFFEPKPLVNEETLRWMRMVGMLVNQLGGEYSLSRHTMQNFDLNSIVSMTEDLETNSIVLRVETPTDANPRS